MSFAEITEHVVRGKDHTTFHLAAGPVDGPLVIFVHGWPELSISWRHQLPVLAGAGFRAIAPDMRGYGRSTVHPDPADYAQEHIVADMLALLDQLGRDAAVWVGHDWGSPVVWNIASHHPERVHGMASLCVPYGTVERGFEPLLELVDRDVYPIDQYPVGQWDYLRHYEESFTEACAVMDSDPYAMVSLLFRAGDPSGVGRPAVTATVRAQGGWFGGGQPPRVPLDPAVLTEPDALAYAAALERNGFFGPNAWYLNHERNAEYAARARNDGRIDLPVLFLGGAFDHVVETVRSRLAEPMRGLCSDLTEHVVASGHWMAQEKPAEVNAALLRWIATRVAAAWPR